MKTNPIPQLSAATALVQLLTEFSDLPMLAWRISDRESLADSLFGGRALEDPRPVVCMWAEALGSEVTETRFPYNGEEHIQFAVEAVWRDVPVLISMSCPASALVETAVAA
ncbi:hypothetical protein ACJWDR_37845 [Streptomyces tauricus]|uniref:hypothetical protein n=1 Tax=Streptomyces tauricus TaxID=68274 RepID=UPI00387F0645